MEMHVAEFANRVDPDEVAHDEGLIMPSSHWRLNMI